MQDFSELQTRRSPSLMAGFRPLGPTAPSSKMEGPGLLMTGPSLRMTGPSSRMQGFGLPGGLTRRERRWHLLVDLAVAGAFVAVALLGNWSA